MWRNVANNQPHAIKVPLVCIEAAVLPVPVGVMLPLVVAAQGSESPQSYGVGEEDLGACIHPHLKQVPSSW